MDSALFVYRIDVTSDVIDANVIDVIDAHVHDVNIHPKPNIDCTDDIELCVEPNKNVECGTPEIDDSSENVVYVANTENLKLVNWTVDLLVSGTTLPFKIDTGADCSCISIETYNTHIAEGLVHSGMKISGISAPTVTPVGRVKLRVNYQGKSHEILCEVLNQKIPNLLGLKDCIKLNLISRVDSALAPKSHTQLLSNIPCQYPGAKGILNEYQDIFRGVGKMPGEVSLKLDPNCTPVAHPPRPIPAALHEAVKDKLEQMESEGIIEKIPTGTPTPWCAPMHTVLKRSKVKNTGKLTKDDVRITIDPKDLNNALQREYHPINTIDEVIKKTHGSKVFTKLDARQGFFQLVLDHESSLLTAFNTPFGRYRHKRLPMGISVAPEIYQRAMQEIFGDIEGCEVIFDDLLLHAINVAIHNLLFRNVLQRARENGVVFNLSKLVLCLPQVEYVGHLLTDHGVKVSPDKVAAVVNMPQPESIANVQTLLGMVTYTCKFVKNLSSLTEPLRQLIKDSHETGFKFHWDTCHQEAFENVKQAMTTTPVLGYYTLDKPIVMSVDASQSGLGAVLLQEDKPVHYASKSLTPSEYNYSQIEKELLAIVWGYTKFHSYLYGRSDVTVVTDHKPLVNLKDKPLFQMPPRIQRLFMKIRHHTFKLIHKPGKEIPIPDCMSRLYQKETTPVETGNPLTCTEIHFAKCLSALPQEDTDDQFTEDTEYVHTVKTEEVRTAHSFSSRRLQEVREETRSDTALQKLISVIRSPKMPESRSEVSPEVRPYFNFLDEMSVIDGIIFKGEKVVIPSSMQREMLGIIHESHLGMVKCKQLARDVLYWPGLNKQIEDMVSRCSACQSHRATQQKEPLLPTEVPERPWQILGTDLFDLDGHKYLIVADYYSEWFEIEHLTKDSTATTVVGKTSKWFATHGVPEKVISDNGPPYNSYKYADFAEKWGFTHQTISPYHSQANGFIEKSVGIAKNILRKCKESKQDPYLAMLNHRNTPRDGVGSPAQRLFGRRTCTRLPTGDTLLEPVTKSTLDVSSRLMADRLKAKSYYDKGAKPLPELNPGDTVRVQTQQGSWIPAKLMEEHPYRSHSVMTPTGSVIRRNRRDILKTREDPNIFQRRIILEEFEDTADTHRRETIPEVAVSPIKGPPAQRPPPKPPSQPQIISRSMPTPSTPISGTPPKPPPRPISCPPPTGPGPPPNVSKHGRVRQPSTRYDPDVYKLK